MLRVARKRIGSTSGHVCWGLVPQQRVVSGETVPPVPGIGTGSLQGTGPGGAGVPKNCSFLKGKLMVTFFSFLTKYLQGLARSISVSLVSTEVGLGG